MNQHLTIKQCKRFFSNQFNMFDGIQWSNTLQSHDQLKFCLGKCVICFDIYLLTYE